jgi:LPXTG-site transpeptidase (sortase) family protein
MEKYEVVGSIKIPKTKLEIPILEKVTKRSLELSIAVFDGPGLNEVGNTTIMGHNYRNGLFFSDNEKLSNGDNVYITDKTGTTIEYEIYKSKDILLTNNTVKQKKRFKYNVKDILNDPPQPYIVKKFPLDIKSKKELMVTVKPLIIEESKSKDNDNDNDEDAKNANSDDINNNNNVVLPPLGQLSVNPILMTRLDMVGKRKMNYNSNKK